jgi:AcrR family transcriptional regulator
MVMTKEKTAQCLLDDDGIDPRVLRTRKLITDSFHELLTEKSFPSISVRDITTRATINRATFYAHFVDKFSLFDYVIARSFHELIQSHLTNTCGFSAENLRLLLLAVRDYLTYHLAHCTPGNQQNIHPIVIRQVRTQVHWFVQRWFEPIADDLDATAALVTGAIIGVGIHYSEKEELEMNVEQMVDVLTYGLNGIGVRLD